MKTIKEPSRTIPVLAEMDVLVIGSGPGDWQWSRWSDVDLHDRLGLDPGCH